MTIYHMLIYGTIYDEISRFDLQQSETLSLGATLLELGLGSDSSAPLLLICLAQTGPGPCTK